MESNIIIRTKGKTTSDLPSSDIPYHDWFVLILLNCWELALMDLWLIFSSARYATLCLIKGIVARVSRNQIWAWINVYFEDYSHIFLRWLNFKISCYIGISYGVDHSNVKYIFSFLGSIAWYTFHQKAKIKIKEI